jgi:hypothetical protein
MVHQLLPDSDPLLDQFAHDLASARASSYPLLFAVYRLAQPEVDAEVVLLDALANSVGYNALGSGWVEVPRRMAAKILTQIIGSELAYPEQVVPRERATELATRFLALFPKGARYYTNGAISGDFAVYDLQGAELLGWRSLSAAPFDNGIVALGSGRIAMLWAEDAP